MTFSEHKAQLPSFEQSIASYAAINLGARHASLAASYKTDPALAMVIDEAETCSDFVPASTHLYTQVTPGYHGLPPINVGTHDKVGGNHDFPNPGEILCAAIAACFDSCVRLITCRLGIELHALSVHVRGEVDVRGTLKMEPGVPVGFQCFALQVDIDAGPGVPEATVQAILKAAEESCVVMQTIRTSPPIEVNAAIASYPFDE